MTHPPLALPLGITTQPSRSLLKYVHKAALEKHVISSMLQGGSVLQGCFGKPFPNTKTNQTKRLITAKFLQKQIHSNPKMFLFFLKFGINLFGKLVITENSSTGSTGNGIRSTSITVLFCWYLSFYVNICKH